MKKFIVMKGANHEVCGEYDTYKEAEESAIIYARESCAQHEHYILEAIPLAKPEKPVVNVSKPTT